MDNLPLKQIERQYLFALAYITTRGSHRDARDKLIQLGYIKPAEGLVITPEGLDAIKRENILSMRINDNASIITEV